MTFGRRGNDQSHPQAKALAGLRATLAESENSRSFALAAQQASPELSFASSGFRSALNGLEQVKQMVSILDQQVLSGRADPNAFEQGIQLALGMLKSCKTEFDQFTGELMARESIFARDRRPQSAFSPDQSTIHCALLDLAYDRFDQIEQSIAALRSAKSNMRSKWPDGLDLDGMEANRVSFKATLERYNELLVRPRDKLSKPMAAALSRLLMVFELMIEKFNEALQNLVVSEAMHGAIGEARQQDRTRPDPAP